MNFTLPILAAVSLSCFTSSAQDPAPDLVDSVAAATLPAVTFTIKRDGLTLTGPDGGDFGEAVRRGQSFTIKDGERLRFFERRSRIRYEVVARLTDKPPVLWIRTTTPTGTKNDLLDQAIGAAKVRVSTIPIK